MLIACQHWVQKPIKFLPAPTFPSTKLSKYGPKVNISALKTKENKETNMDVVGINCRV